MPDIPAAALTTAPATYLCDRADEMTAAITRHSGTALIVVLHRIRLDGYTALADAITDYLIRCVLERARVDHHIAADVARITAAVGRR